MRPRPSDGSWAHDHPSPWPACTAAHPRDRRGVPPDAARCRRARTVRRAPVRAPRPCRGDRRRPTRGAPARHQHLVPLPPDAPGPDSPASAPTWSTAPDAASAIREAFRQEDFREYAVGFVGDVLDVLGLDAAHLVGASGGGIWATWYSLAHPERVRGLVMLGSVPTLPGGRVPLPLRLAATPGIGDLMVRAVKPGRRMLLKMMASVGEAETIVRHPDLLDSLVAGARDPVATQANLAELRALISPRGIRTSMRLSREDLRRLAVPTLMIWGDRDPVVPLVQARAVAAEIPARPPRGTTRRARAPAGQPGSGGRTAGGFRHGDLTRSAMTRETGRVIVGAPGGAIQVTGSWPTP